MNNFVKIGELDTTPILAELYKADKWHEDTFLRDYPQGPFGEVDSVILRFPPRTVHETEELLKEYSKYVDIWDCQWLPISQDFAETKKFVFNLAHSVQATRIGRVILNRIKPGGRIFRHADTPEHAQTWCRFHIVVHALPGVKFYCGSGDNEELVQMTSGEVWFFRNELEHEVINESAEDRIHLVIDLRVEEIKP